jgi:hypothetical protein
MGNMLGLVSSPPEIRTVPRNVEPRFNSLARQHDGRRGSVDPHAPTIAAAMTAKPMRQQAKDRNMMLTPMMCTGERRSAIRMEDYDRERAEFGRLLPSQSFISQRNILTHRICASRSDRVSAVLSVMQNL